MMTRFRPSPAMVVALLALFVSLGGVGYAATKIGTSQIRNGAVTAKKLHNRAVTARKIRDGAVSWRKTDGSLLPAGAAGVAVAGVNVAPSGTVRRYFNRAGGAPTVSHPTTGTYQIVFPGLGGLIRSNSSITLATLIAELGEVRVTSAGKTALIKTATSAGVPANRSFNYVVLLHSP
jgi:hypothetical protein